MATDMAAEEDDASWRQRMLGVIRELAPTIPERPLRDVENEIEEIRAARRAGGRGGAQRGDR